MMRIIFMGTPDFAVPSLEILAEHSKTNQWEVVAVITAPDKPSGRGLQIQQSDVKLKALELGIPVLQPTNLKNPDFMEELKSFHADLQVVVAFRMLPEAVWSMPKYGSINLHGSLLPQYRGAAPINWAIINGEKSTGVSTFFLKHQIDTGNIIAQKEIPILETDNFGSLYNKLKLIGKDLMLQTVIDIQNNAVMETPQDEEIDIKHAPKIFKADCQIDWNKSAKQVFNLIRGLSPFPGSFTHYDGKMIKIHKSELTNIPCLNMEPGTIKVHEKNLWIATADDFLQINELQLEGKKRMFAQDFLRGFTFPELAKFYSVPIKTEGS